MQFPVWGASFLVGKAGLAAVAILLVFVAHAAAGLAIIHTFLLRRAQYTGSDLIDRFLRQNSSRILLIPSVVTMLLVLGTWSYASLARPALVSTIIHTFMWLLAIQAIAITLQNLAAYAYAFYGDRLSPERQMATCWIYMICAFLPVITISAITSFMLTPGKWLATFHHWDALINPTFMPSLIIHILWVLVVGCTVLIFIVNSSSGLTDDEKHDLEKMSGKWMWVLAAALPIAPLYLMAARATDSSPAFLIGGILLTAIVVLHFFVTQFLRKDQIGWGASLTLILVLFAATASFDLAQARLRGPYSIAGYLYSNGIAVADVKELMREGILEKAHWMIPRGTDLVRVPSTKRGEWVFRSLRYEWYFGRDAKILRERIRGLNRSTLQNYIRNIHNLDRSIPPFVGNPQELDDLIDYLILRREGEG